MDYHALRQWNVPAELAQGPNRLSVPLAANVPTGRYFVELRMRIAAGGKILDWGAAAYEVTRTARVVSLQADRETYQPGDNVALEAHCEGVEGGAEAFELSDSFGRLLATAEVPAGPNLTVRLPLRNVRATVHEARLTIHRGDDRLAEARAPVIVPFRRTRDFYFLTWRSGFGPDARSMNIARTLRSYGVDVLSNGGFAAAASAAAYGMTAVPYSMSTHGLLLDKHLFNAEYREQLQKSLRQGAAQAKRYGVLAYTLGDEPYVSAFTEAGRFSAGDAARAAFQAYLQRIYGDAAALNRQWGTAYGSFAEIRFDNEADLLRRPENPSPWCDYRMFVTAAFLDLLRTARDALHEVDPAAPVGFDGAENSSSYDGFDWYEMARLLDMPGLYLRPYSPHKLFNVYCVRSFARPGAITGYWDNERDWETSHYAPWHSVFNGFNTFWWWESTFIGSAHNTLAADFRPSVFFAPQQPSCRRSSRASLPCCTTAGRGADGVAVHYSQNNFHAGTLACGNIRHVSELGDPYPLFNVNPAMAGHYVHASKCWFLLLNDLGVGFDMLARQQFENGELTADRFKILVLPFVQSLSEAEARAIREYVAAGGTVIADYMAGIRDGHCRPVSPGLLDDVFGIRRQGGDLLREARATISHGWGSVAAQLDNVLLETGIEAVTAEKWGLGTGGRPVMLVNSFGKGKAVYLAFGLYGWEARRRERQEWVATDMFQNLLTSTSRLQLGEVVLDEQGLPARAVEIYRFDDGAARYVGLLPDVRTMDKRPIEGRLRVCEGLHHYDVRSGRYLGSGREVPVPLRPGQAVLLASLPYRVTGLTAAADAAQVRRGATVTLMGTVEVSAGPPCRHVLRAQVFKPGGEREPLYDEVLETSAGRFTFQVPTALNDPPGRWTVRVRDVVGASTTEPTFDLQ